MQIDMHYYGTYAMARAAGLAPETCRTVATAAQFVDDNVAGSSVEFGDGARIDAEATAHHVADIANVQPDDQRRVWVPFHFLPGNEGEGYTDRLRCRKDSGIAKEMVSHHLDCADRAFAEALIGIAAHVYGDTFSHYGFSGVSSRGNRIKNDSIELSAELNSQIREYIRGKAAAFFGMPKEKIGFLKNIKSWLAETASGALGHGAVATYPDRPYLSWSFEYEFGDEGRVERPNPTTYLEGCRALHDMFRRFAANRPDFAADGGQDFDEIQGQVVDIIAVQANKQGRLESWKRASESGNLYAGEGEEIPDYEGERWNQDWERLDKTEASGPALDVPVYRFYQAAALHRTYVLRDLLPKYGLIVD